MNLNFDQDFPHPRDLIYFQEVAATANLSRASERLGIGQSTLSLSLKRLEDLLQVSLFTRTTRGLKLTAPGDRLLQRSNSLLDEWRALVNETRRLQTDLRGRFRLGCHPSVALYALNPFLNDFYRDYPGIEFQLIHAQSRVVCEQVISGRIDFGFVVNPVRHPDLVIRKLATDEVGFWSRTGERSEVLVYNPDLIQSQTLLRKAAPLIANAITSESLEVISAIARSGMGMAILPTRVTQALAPELRRITDLPTYLDQVTFCYRRDLPRSAAVTKILEATKNLRL